MDSDTSFEFYPTALEEEEKKLAYRQHIDAVRQAVIDVAKTPQGKVFLRWLITEECGFMSSYFPRDEKVSIWNAAKRDTALKIVRTVQTGGIYDIINNTNKD